MEYFFPPFHVTYKRITWFLTLGLMFPNPATDRCRIISIVLLLASSVPIIMLILIDIYKSWCERDMYNIIRHSTIIGPFVGSFLKMFLMYYKRVSAKKIMDEMNRDYEILNNLPCDHQRMADETIKESVFYAEGVWCPLVIICISVFPGMAVVLTLYNYMFLTEPQKYMIHDINKPSSPPEDRFSSPYYECLFVYTFIVALISICNFVSYDAFFGLATNHACLKINLCCKKLQDVFRAREILTVRNGVAEFVEDQKRMFKFVELIQDTYNIWLGMIYTCTMIQIGSLLYHITAGYGFDLRYTLFSVTSVLHIFLPCKHAAKLKSMGSDMATQVYCSGWEKSSDRRVARSLMMVIARSQRPLHITAFNLLVYDMELFVFMMRTSYSMFTLLRS